MNIEKIKENKILIAGIVLAIIALISIGVDANKSKSLSKSKYSALSSGEEFKEGVSDEVKPLLDKIVLDKDLKEEYDKDIVLVISKENDLTLETQLKERVSNSYTYVVTTKDLYEEYKDNMDKLNALNFKKGGVYIYNKTGKPKKPNAAILNKYNFDIAYNKTNNEILYVKTKSDKVSMADILNISNSLTGTDNKDQ